MAARDYDHLFKFVLLAEGAVGKTSLLRRFIDNTFKKQYKATIGVDFEIKKLQNSGKTLKLQVVE